MVPNFPCFQCGQKYVRSPDRLCCHLSHKPSGVAACATAVLQESPASLVPCTTPPHLSAGSLCTPLVAQRTAFTARSAGGCCASCRPFASDNGSHADCCTCTGRKVSLTVALASRTCVLGIARACCSRVVGRRRCVVRPALCCLRFGAVLVRFASPTAACTSPVSGPSLARSNTVWVCRDDTTIWVCSMFHYYYYTMLPHAANPTPQALIWSGEG